MIPFIFLLIIRSGKSTFKSKEKSNYLGLTASVFLINNVGAEGQTMSKTKIVTEIFVVLSIVAAAVSFYFMLGANLA